MISFLRAFSAVLFYLLGATFFLAYIFLRNGILGLWPAFFMQVADLPFIAVSLLYGGLSLFMSIQRADRFSHIIPWLVSVPLIAIFVTMLVFNFWPVPVGE